MRLFKSMGVFIFALASTLALALPHNDPVPGGVVTLSLPAPYPQAPKVFFNQHRIMLLKQASSWVAVIGLPLSIPPGPHEVLVQPVEGPSFKLPFVVKDKHYQAEYLTLTNKRQVEPNPQDVKRIQADMAEMNAVFSHWSPHADHKPLPFIKPAQGPFSDNFGLRRFFNGQVRNPHSGIDIRVPEGAPIIAPAPGRVQVTNDYFFNGNTVLIDHGQGLVSLFCHLSRIDVKAGDIVKRGEQIGLVGKTGRATGPHLHWSVSLNDARVNPRLFISERTHPQGYATLHE